MPNDAIRIKLDGGDELIEALQELDANMRRTLKAATVAGAEVVAAVANGMAPGPHIETAVTRATATEAEVAIGPDNAHWYYRFMETGAAPHEIRARRDNAGNALVFEGDAARVVTPVVRHPGMTARPFLRPAHDETQDDARDALGAELRAEIERVRAR